MPETDIEIRWDGAARRNWRTLTARAHRCAFEQGWCYGAAMAARPGTTVRRAVLCDRGGPVAVVQAFARRFGGAVTVVQILRGPVWLRGETTADEKVAILRRIRSTIRRGPRELIFWTPELTGRPGLTDRQEVDGLMRDFGRRRVVTGYGSAILDLARPEQELRAGLHVKWRNALTRAESGDLATGRIRDAGGIDWLLRHYDELRRRRRFGGPTAATLRRIAADAQRDDLLMLRASIGGEPVAATMFVRHGGGASYTVGWTGAEGRRRYAGTLLLWRGILELRARDVSWLDLGGIDTRRAPGIARFKLGTGGVPYTLAGTYF